MSQKLKVVAYIRVSTEMQEKAESLDTQELNIRRFCRENNYDLICVYSDVMSGGNRKRKGFNSALSHIEKGGFDIFLAYDVSRIARDAYAFLKLYNKLREKDIKLKLINNPNLNSDSALGRLILTILAAIFEFFRFDNSERVSDSAKVKVLESGKRMAGNAPYGYRMENKKLIVHKEESETIKKMFEEVENGTSIKQVSEILYVPYTTAYNRLRNATYAGLNQYGKTKQNKETYKSEKNKDFITAKGDWEGIITIEQFENVQKILNDNVLKYQKTQHYQTYLLTSMIKCSCGGNMKGSSSNKIRFFYRCKECGKHVKRDELEQKVINELLSSDIFKMLNNQIEKDIKMFDTNKSIEQKIKKIESKKDILLDNLLDNTITKEIYNKKLNELDSQILSYTTELELNEQKINNFEKIVNIDIYNAFKEILATYDIKTERKNIKDILTKLIEKIELENITNNPVSIYLKI